MTGSARGSPLKLALICLVLAVLACNAAEITEDATTTADDTTSTDDTSDSSDSAPEDDSECPFSGAFASDITIPDGTTLTPGTSFDKTWQLENDGCQDWPEGTILVFDHGDRMGGPDFVSIPGTPAGSTATVTVPLTAPSAPGTYTGYWQCQSPDGVRFCQIDAQITIPEPPAPEPPAPEPPAEAEPVNVILPAEPAPLSGSISPSNCTDVLQAGSTPNGNPYRLHLSFNISPYQGKTITQAYLNLSDYSQIGDAFLFFGTLNVQIAFFDEFCAYPFSTGEPVLASVDNISLGRGRLIDVTDALNAVVNASSVGDYFQVKIYFPGDFESTAFPGNLITWDSIHLSMSYLP